MRNLKETNILFDEMETQLREKPLWGSPTQDIHYLEDKASYKVVALIYPGYSGRTLNSNV
jgi:hypothetical protein